MIINQLLLFYYQDYLKFNWSYTTVDTSEVTHFFRNYVISILINSIKKYIVSMAIFYQILKISSTLYLLNKKNNWIDVNFAYVLFYTTVNILAYWNCIQSCRTNYDGTNCAWKSQLVLLDFTVQCVFYLNVK